MKKGMDSFLGLAFWTGLVALGTSSLFGMGILGCFQIKAPSQSSQPNSVPGVQEAPLGTTSENEIIFAAQSGLPPRYIDSGRLKGQGWREHQTLEVRKGMENDGFRFKYEYMSPARIEHEFQVGSPICTFPMEWNRPKQQFAQKPDRLLSIALDFTEEQGLPILFRNQDRSRFQKHLDSKGDLNVDQLLEDPNFKLLLIRNKDYGRFTQKLTTFDAKGDQVVRKAYEKHVSLLLVRDNQQLIEMLNAQRFDYIFAGDIEDQDFRATGLNRQDFFKLNYATARVKDLTDPNLVRVSIACSLHPSTIRALPSFNKWIALLRGWEWKESNVIYRKGIDKDFVHVNQPATTLLAYKFLAQLKDGAADGWYPLQQSYFSELRLFPSRAKEEKDPLLPSVRQSAAEWKMLQEPDGVLVIANASEFYWNPESNSLIRDGDRSPMHLWDRRDFALGLPPKIVERIAGYDFAREEPGEKNFRDLNWPEFSGLRSLILFARGIPLSELGALRERLLTSKLESLSLLDASPDVARELVSALPSTLIDLNLRNSSLHDSKFSSRIGALQNLRHLNLTATELPRAEFTQVLKSLPRQMESLGLGYLGPSWTEESVKAFAVKGWTTLRSLDLSNGFLDRSQLAQILSAIPSSIQTLDLSRNHGDDRSLEAIRFENLSELKLSKQEFYSPLHPVRIPKSVESLDVSFGIRPMRTDLIEVSSQIRSLDAAFYGFDGSKIEIGRLLKKLGPQVDFLGLSGIKLNPTELTLLVEGTGIRHINRLDLTECGLKEDGVEILSRAHFSLTHLILDRNFIQDRGAELLAKRFAGSLKTLSLSFNPITSSGVKVIAEHLQEGLRGLDLAAVSGLDLGALVQNLPKTLRRLNLSGNLLSDAEIQLLAPRLPHHLRELNLKGSAFGAKGVLALVQFMPKYLTVLNLERVPIEDRGFRILVRGLPQTLTELYLSDLDLEDQSVESFASSVPPFLRVLQMEAMRWSENASSSLLSSLPNSLETLRLTGSLVSPRGARSLSLHWPASLRYLSLSGTKLGDAGLIALSQTLPPTLQRIDLNSSGITDSGLIALARHPLEHLVAIELANNHFSAQGMAALDSQKRGWYSLHLSGSHLDSKALAALGPNTLAVARRLQIGNNPLSNQTVVKFLKKLNPSTKLLYLPSVGLKFEGIDEVIQNLPPGLGVVQIGGNEIGEKGLQKFERFAAERERTRLYLFLVK